MQTKRMVWLDGLRLLAGMSMVVLHTTADPSGQPWINYPESERYGPIILRTFAYTARTELFLLIASFLLVLSLCRRPRSYRATIFEQSKRLLLPFVFWTLFYCCFNLIKAHHFGYLDTALKDITSPARWLSHFVLGDIKFHMHFLPTLFGLLLFYPLFMVAYRYPIVGLAVLPLLLIKWELDQQVWSLFWDAEALPFLVRFVKIVTYVGYGMAAASLAHVWENSSFVQRRSILSLFVFFSLLLLGIKFVAAYRSIVEAQWQYSYAAGYWSDFLMPIILFYVCMALSDKNWPRIVSKFGSYSFGIYLCHPIFVDLAEIFLRQTDINPMQQVIFKLSAAISLSPVLVFAISKTQILAWTVGLGPLPQLATLASSYKRSSANAGHNK